MILKNAVNLAKNLTLMGGLGNAHGSTMNPIVYPLRDVEGNEITTLTTNASYSSYTTYVSSYPFLLNFYNAPALNYTSRADYAYIVYGTGSTAVTENDYKLESLITSGITNQNSTMAQSLTITKGNDGKSVNKKKLVTSSVKNTSATDIVIREVGVYQMVIPNGSSYTTTKNVLMYREVLREPVTIPAGSYKTFEFEFNITHTEG